MPVSPMSLSIIHTGFLSVSRTGHIHSYPHAFMLAVPSTRNILSPVLCRARSLSTWAHMSPPQSSPVASQTKITLYSPVVIFYHITFFLNV